MADYLTRKKGSQNWWLQLQYRGDLAERLGTKKVEKSLGTPDKREAEIKAMPDIRAHKLLLLMHRKAKEGTLLTENTYEFEPGKVHLQEDGSQVVAQGDRVIRILPDGSTKTEPNPAKVKVTLHTSPEERRDINRVIPQRKTPDDDIIDYWVKQKGIGKHNAGEARQVWDVYRDLIKKPLIHATREDGIKVVQHFLDKGNKSKTVDKKVGMLRAAINLSIKHQRVKLTLNPFSDVIPEMKDEVKRLPISENDMKLLRARLHVLAPEDQLLFTWLAATGMRLSEPIGITEEHEANGIRYVIVGTKTDSSLRRVPIPEAVLPLLPEKIEGPLFSTSAETHGKRLRYWMRKSGIKDPRKVIHSLRHRAADRLREARCPTVIRWQLLGHEDNTVAEDYGEGEPVAVLKEWVDKIGA